MRFLDKEDYIIALLTSFPQQVYLLLHIYCYSLISEETVYSIWAE